jgi:hypothetical protein
MATVCYKWSDAPFAWMETPFTWAEGCIIAKIVENIGAGGMQSIRRFREKIKELTKEEKEVLIKLFVRLEVDEIEIEKKVNKNKNTKVKIKLKDIEVAMAQEKFIKVNVKINED